MQDVATLTIPPMARIQLYPLEVPGANQRFSDHAVPGLDLRHLVAVSARLGNGGGWPASAQAADRA
jgi:hypothetical protein